MKKLIADLHMHTIASGHSYGTIREMASTACDRGLELIGITEHAPGIPGTIDPIYFLNFQVIPKHIYGVEVLHGSEINVLNDGTLSLSQRHIDHLDYAIAGIHSLCYENVGKEQNTTNTISCMKNPKVKIISHPDDDNFPLNYERLVDGAKTYDVALELNNSSLVKKEQRLNCYENYQVMLDLCKQQNVPIIVDSDAHDPFWVGNFSLAYELLKQLNFDEELILNNDIQKLKNFILSK